MVEKWYLGYFDNLLKTIKDLCSFLIDDAPEAFFPDAGENAGVDKFATAICGYNPRGTITDYPDDGEDDGDDSELVNGLSFVLIAILAIFKY